MIFRRARLGASQRPVLLDSSADTVFLSAGLSRTMSARINEPHCGVFVVCSSDFAAVTAPGFRFALLASEGPSNVGLAVWYAPALRGGAVEITVTNGAVGGSRWWSHAVVRGMSAIRPVVAGVNSLYGSGFNQDASGVPSRTNARGFAFSAAWSSNAGNTLNGDPNWAPIRAGTTRPMIQCRSLDAPPIDRVPTVGQSGSGTIYWLTVEVASLIADRFISRDETAAPLDVWFMPRRQTPYRLSG